MKEVGTQGHGATEVVADDVRIPQAPVLQEIDEQVALHIERHGMVGVLGRGTVARHVPQVHGEVGGERLCVGANSPDDHGVPWQKTTSGPDPARRQCTRLPRQ